MGGIEGVGGGTGALRRTVSAVSNTVANTSDSTIEAVNQANAARDAAGLRDTRPLGRVANSSNLVKGLGVAGMAAGLVTFAKAAKDGNINDMIGGLSDVAANMASMLEACKNVPGGLELIKKLGGPAAIIGGITSAIAALKDAKANGLNAGNAMRMASGVLTSVAGVAMMVPGGQPVAAAAAAIAGGLSLGALAYDSREQIAAGAKKVAGAAKDALQSAGNAFSRASNFLFGS